MTPIQFRTVDLSLDADLADATIEPLLGELQITSPILAEKVRQAAFDVTSNVVLLEEQEVELLVAAAQVVSTSMVDDDPALDRLVGLGATTTPPTWSAHD